MSPPGPGSSGSVLLTAERLLAYRELEKAARAVVKWWGDGEFNRTDFPVCILRDELDALDEQSRREREQALRQSEARTERNLRASGPSVGPSRFS